MNIELTEKQRENLIVFLQRVDLKGSEVPAYMEIAAALNKPFEDAIKNDKNCTQSESSD